MTEKTYKRLLGYGIAVLIIYFIGSFYIQNLGYIRLGFFINLLLLLLIMTHHKFNKILIYNTAIFMLINIIFYTDIRALLV